MFKRTQSLAPLLAVFLAVLAAPLAGAVRIEPAIQQALRSANLGQSTQVAIFFRDLTTGEVYVDLEPDTPLIPASNMKLITAVAALDTLSPDFGFNTTLGLIAPDDPDHGRHTLVITGDGDPAFGDPQLLEQHGHHLDDLLDAWVDAVKQTGVTRFDRLLVDDRVFDQTFTHPRWEKNDLLQPYGAQVAGLNFHDNIIKIMPTPGSYAGQAPRIELLPHAPFIKTTNRARTGAKDLFTIHRDLGGNHLKFAGTLKKRPPEPWQITIHDPPMFFGRLLAHRLAEAGIRVDAVTRPGPNAQLPEAQVLHVVRTMLPVALARVNQDSQNMFAEAVLKRTGHAFTGAAGSWNNGAAAVRHVLADRLGPRSAAITVSDGSGLSRDNRVTARLLVDLLDNMHRDPELADAFRETLAYAGKTPDGQYHAAGTFAPSKRFNDLPVGHWVLGKSGALTGVCSLSGYLVIPLDNHQPPRIIAFSMIFNGYKPPIYGHKVRALQGQIIKLVDRAVSDPVRIGG